MVNRNVPIGLLRLHHEPNIQVSGCKTRSAQELSIENMANVKYSTRRTNGH